MWWLWTALLTAVIAVLFGFYLLSPTFDMVDLTLEPELNRAKLAGKTAFIVGFTGEIGKVLLKELSERKIFGKILLLGRRDFDVDINKYPNAVFHKVDFDNFESHQSLLDGVEFGFCSLGTTRKIAGVDGFRKVDHDYVVSVAKVAKSAGVKDFSLISSQGANANSPFLYPQVKGQVEAEVTQIGFERLTIFRPAVLLCDRAERRLGEKFFVGLMKPISWVSPTFITVPTETVAKAMLMNLWRQNRLNVEILDNSAIHQLGKDDLVKQHFDQQ